MRRAIPVVLVLGIVAFVGCDKLGMGGTKTPKLKTEDQKTLYALGLVIGRNVEPFGLTPAELEIVQAGMRDAMNKKGKPKVELETYGPKIQMLAQKRAAKVAEKEKANSAGFLAKAAKEKGAVKTASGLVYTTLKAGNGPSPKATDRVKVHYHGTLTDGTVFDSSVQRGEPVEFPLGGVIPCWTEGVQRMKVGEKAKLVCPANIAYGAEGRPPKIPGNATLVFEVQLISISS